MNPTWLWFLGNSWPRSTTDGDARLLEQNVRVFLQASGQGQPREYETQLLNSPEMFFAYNNGITATAERVVTEESSGGTAPNRGMHNFQIVNGGQTTASIHAALTNIGTSTSNRVFVQMKLSIVES